MNVQILKKGDGTCCWCRKEKMVLTVQFPNEQPQPFCLKDFDRMVEMKLPNGKNEDDSEPSLFKGNGIPEALIVP
jgi:hypothetical protein